MMNGMAGEGLPGMPGQPQMIQVPVDQFLKQQMVRIDQLLRAARKINADLEEVTGSIGTIINQLQFGPPPGQQPPVEPPVTLPQP